MYFSSLGCQQWSPLHSYSSSSSKKGKGKFLSLGVGGLAPLTVTATMLLLPLLIMSKLSATCNNYASSGWASKVCSSVNYYYNADINSTTSSTEQADCGNLNTGKALAASTLAIGLLLAWGGKILSSFSAFWSKIPRVLGATFMTLGPLCVWAAQGNAAIVPPVSYHVTAACFSAFTLVSEIWQLYPSSIIGCCSSQRKGSRKAADSTTSYGAPPPATTTTSALYQAKRGGSSKPDLIMHNYSSYSRGFPFKLPSTTTTTTAASKDK